MKNRTMIKRLMVIGLVVGMLSCMTGCGTRELLQQTKAVENAAQGNLPDVICMDGEINTGKDALEDFFVKTKTGQPAQITIKSIYSHEDGETENSDGFTKKIAYGGTYYECAEYDEKGLLTSREKYKYLIKVSGRGSRFVDYDETCYYLTHDDTLTYEQIMWSYVSSQSSDWIDCVLLAKEKQTEESAASTAQVVLRGHEIVSGKDELQDFYAKTNAGESATLILKDLGAEEENEKADIIYTEISYDGEYYTCTAHTEDGDSIRFMRNEAYATYDEEFRLIHGKDYENSEEQFVEEKQYREFVLLSDRPEHASYDNGVRYYYLSNETHLTYDKIMWNLMQSSTTSCIDIFYVARASVDAENET